MSRGKGGRPTKSAPEWGDAAPRLLAEGVPRTEIAARLGIGRRSLQDRLRRGRAGEPAFAAWAERFDRVAEVHLRRRDGFRVGRLGGTGALELLTYWSTKGNSFHDPHGHNPMFTEANVRALDAANGAGPRIAGSMPATRAAAASEVGRTPPVVPPVVARARCRPLPGRSAARREHLAAACRGSSAGAEGRELHL